MPAITQYGYLPAYGPNPPHRFTRQFDQTVAVSCDTLYTDQSASVRVLMQCEPPSLYRDFYGMVMANWQNFDLILTYDDRLLVLPNAKEFLPVDAWVGDIDCVKQDQVTYMMSSKIWTREHRMRFMILREVENKTRLGAFEFKMHRSPPRIPSKEDFYRNAKFNIACENQVMTNMFTEKLLDCFRTLTIPIYYGCENIEKYFNPKGLIRFDTFDQWKNIVYSLTPDHYDQMLPYALENQALAKPYWQKNIFARIEDEVEKHINLALEQKQNQISWPQTA
jgi:hypothetical protein